MKKAFSVLTVMLCSAWLAWGTTSVNISGTVTKTGGGPLQDVVVTLAKISGISATTNADGKFTLASVRALQMNAPRAAPLEFSFKENAVVFSNALGAISGNIEVFSGNGRRTASIHFANLQPASQSVTLPEFGPGINIVRMTIDQKIYNCPVVRLGNDLYLKNISSLMTADWNFMLGKKAGETVDDTLIAKKQGYTDKKTPITSYTLSDVAISMDSTGGESKCQIPPLPAFSDLKSIAELPDPFKMMDGTRITKKSQWQCKREEIKALAQKCIYGWKPGKPDKMEPSYSGGQLTIKCTVGGASGSFSVTISGNSGTGPFPAIICVASSAVYGVPSGVAKINFNEQAVAASGVTGRKAPSGMFYNLYPSYKSTGSLMAWAWAISRVLDALEQTDIQSQTNIDPKKVGVTGCSYAGKAAFAIGVWDERIALTLPVESGAGGVVAWRIAEEFAPPGKKQNDQNGCQYLFETYDESTWLGDSINMFRGKENTLPIDMHEVAALIAPRGLLGLGYSTKWICAQGEWGTGLAANMVYDALGYPDNMGMLIGNAGQHCAKSTKLNEQTVYNAFVNKFLKGDAAANTSPSVALRNDAGYPMTDAKYIPWTKPTLADE